ncbi:MAG TPA: hypothetical protein ENI23_00490 [bacterium]|nr:hypothetical protein [bacterium]
MKKWFQDKILSMAIFSENLQRIGLGLIILVSVYDILRFGMFRFRDYGISYKGILLIWLGVGLIVMSKKADRWGERMTDGGRK